VVVLTQEFLQREWPMWELGVMMAALPDHEQPEPHARAVLPVFLMDLDNNAVVTAYQQYWTPAAIENAREKGRPPATVADLKRLLSYQGIRQDQVRADNTVLILL